MTTDPTHLEVLIQFCRDAKEKIHSSQHASIDALIVSVRYERKQLKIEIDKLVRYTIYERKWGGKLIKPNGYWVKKKKLYQALSDETRAAIEASTREEMSSED